MECSTIHQDKEWLVEQYQKTKSIYKMAEIAECHPRTVHKWMRKHRIPMSGMKGRNHDDETKKKISAGVLAAAPKSMSGKKHSAKTRKEMSLNRTGSKNSNWKGGKTNQIRKLRRTKEYIKWRDEVIKRAGGVCEDCGSKKDIEAHHIISVHKDITKIFDIENGAAVCKECHKTRQEKGGISNV